ncbi:hypothetical protein MIND_00054400 [Mycena indigotica]|uniref:General stress protein FMN-binding split barrel domain-containing protein n=1 Tax=Mycena indigotica TaxID=2126181 RepID=A0A8H6TEP5_9AGAR|nr:uncharacterized protein MIND_00054400 [Mycena indigotica]KAF7315397.1 hypothetical protein MIND_00054400 [Mycena indigotica]
MAETLDPYTTQAENTTLSPQAKIEGLHTIVKSARIGMLTTHCSDGQFHSRAMIPSTPFTEMQLTLVFVANNASSKFDEIKNDSNVNVSFCDTSTTSWASYSGRAKISQDKELIAKHFSPSMAAYFGDLKDGVHTGKVDDPRISIIEVIPDEIRYWVATKGAVGRAADTAISMVTGKASAPGEIRTISKAEIQLTQELHMSK